MNKTSKFLSINKKKGYLVPIGSTNVRLEVKNSVFINNLGRANNNIEIINFIKKINKSHSKASQNCWAYIIGNPLKPEKIGTNDDKEPRGSAGKPMMNVLMQNRVGCVVSVTTRYYGGIKLGIGKLIRTYSKITSLALKNISLRNFHLQKNTKISIPYFYEKDVFHFIKKMNIIINNIKYEENINFEIISNIETCTNFAHKIKEITKGKIIIKSSN